MGWYAFTIFLSAFLLFAVQPLMGKYILPWFGGGPGVWTACMLFFQCVLLVGYSYAHLISSRLGPSRQKMLHLGALALSLLLLPIAPEPSWKPTGAEQPTRHILLLLLVNIGVPFALLSSTGPLLSRWFSHSFPARSPYRLYALSNAGSLLALLSYPFVVEPFLALRTQAWIWSLGYGAFVPLCGWCAWRFGRSDEALYLETSLSIPEPETPPGDLASKAEPNPAPGSTDRVLWLALAATASVMLLATTHQVSQDLAVIPLLWVLPLALYLLSFILCFNHDRWYKRWIFGPLLAVGALAVVYIMPQDLTLSAWIQIGVYSTMLFACCMVCHGELARLRPGANYLTRFYLIIGIGGALGGVAVAVVAPLVLKDFWEYHLGLTATCLLAMVCVQRDTAKRRRRDILEKPKQDTAPANPRLWLAWGGTLLLFSIIIAGLVRDVRQDQKRAIETARNFFGVIHILEADKMRLMEHGRSLHGTQSLHPSMRKVPTTYFGRDSGIGIALDEYRRLQMPRQDINTGQIQSQDPASGPHDTTLRIGVIGLGTGTIATLTRPGDYLRFYEINPSVERLARKYFTYMDDAAAKVDVIFGDARIRLEHEAQNGQYQNFDVLAVDAFNSDAPPLHLLTREAMELYFAHLKPRGLLAFNVSNRYVNLSSVVRGLAQSANRQSVRIYTTGQGMFEAQPADWVIVTNNPSFLADEVVQVAATEWSNDESLPILWTDEYASLWRAVAANKGRSRGKWDGAPNKGQFTLDNARLIADADIGQIRWLCRKLYHDTGGTRAITVVTARAIPTIRGRSISPYNYIEYLYRKFGLSERERISGLMILISTAHNLTFIKTPEDWPPELQQQATQVISTMMADGTTASEFSARLLSGIEALDLLMRHAP